MQNEFQTSENEFPKTEKEFQYGSMEIEFHQKKNTEFHEKQETISDKNHNSPRKDKQKKRILQQFLAITAVVCVSVVALPELFFQKEEHIETKRETFEEITFGSYEQDDNIQNGAEPIVWLVLADDGQKQLVISKYSLWNAYFSDSEYCVWQDSNIRKELNDEFYNIAFTEAEQNRIIETEVSNEVCVDATQPVFEEYGTVQDKMFLLSESEIAEYFPIDIWKMNGYYASSAALRTVSTDAVDADERIFSQEEYEIWYSAYPESVINTYACYWFTRTVSPDNTPGLSGKSVTCIDPNGSTHEFIFDMFSTVRPAMWILK